MMERRMAVVIEDDGDLRLAMAEALRRSGFAVRSAASGAEGLGSVREHNPDIVVIDSGLPDFDGFEASRRIRTFSDAYVIMVSGRADDADALMAFEAGADDYLTKPVRPRELRARARAMFRRPRGIRYDGAGHHSSPPPSGAGRAEALPADRFDFVHRGLSLHKGIRRVVVDGAPVALTRGQFDILLVLMENGRTVQTKADLVRRLRNEPYSTDSFVSAGEERAVEVQLSSLRKRLGDSPRRPRWVETVHGVGYRMTP
ncbi:response regulator transcription factor [Pseudarthrobacter oxydans]|uniref:response regulator transcription factor n=1 Tax=Pseudarthrobacter oxydans TaxID=1671 RepID=UPI003424E329